MVNILISSEQGNIDVLIVTESDEKAQKALDAYYVSNGTLAKAEELPADPERLEEDYVEVDGQYYERCDEMGDPLVRWFIEKMD